MFLKESQEEYHTVVLAALTGGKLGFKADLDGLYLLLAGIGSIFVTAAKLTFALQYPFPY